MQRILSATLLLALLASGVEAATDFGAMGSGDSGAAHEEHGGIHDEGPGPPGKDGKDPHHYCHCTAHAPAVSLFVSMPSFARTAIIGSTANHLIGTHGPPPLLKPPKLG
jgi:hypothetical protein